MSTRIEIDRLQKVRDIFHKNQYVLDDRFVIRDGKYHKCAIICPGGGYQLVCSFVEGVPFAKVLNQKGISAFIVYYRVRDKAAYPNPQDDLARAVQEIISRKEEYMVDMEDYSVWGSSAGGHLAASFGTTKMGYPHYGLPKPSAIILVYPVITLEEEKTHLGSRENLLGKKASEEKALAYSIQTNVDQNYPRTFVWCGDADEAVPPENTKKLAAALKAQGIAYEAHIYPGVPHGVGTAKGLSAEGWIDQAVEFWMKDGQ